MKEHIYTIPVMDAFRAAAGEPACPVCVMRRKLDSDSLAYTLGPSYMEEDTRAQTDKVGFCAEHWEKLYACQNRLGLSLIMHTHILHIIREMDKHKAAGNPLKRKGMFAKQANTMHDRLREAESGCFICSRVNRSLDRYIDTMFFMWPDTPELLALTRQSGGFCLSHFVGVLNTGPAKLKERDWSEFYNTVVPIQRETFETIEADLGWFIQKFDYRNSGEPWGNSKDALPRALKTIGRAGMA